MEGESDSQVGLESKQLLTQASKPTQCEVLSVHASRLAVRGCLKCLRNSFRANSWRCSIFQAKLPNAILYPIQNPLSSPNVSSYLISILRSWGRINSTYLASHFSPRRELMESLDPLCTVVYTKQTCLPPRVSPCRIYVRTSWPTRGTKGQVRWEMRDEEWEGEDTNCLLDINI